MENNINKGKFIASLVFFIIAIFFTVFTIIMFTSALEIMLKDSAENDLSGLALIAIIPFYFIFLVPSFISSSISLIISLVALNKQKESRFIILLALAILCLVILIGSVATIFLI